MIRMKRKKQKRVRDITVDGQPGYEEDTDLFIVDDAESEHQLEQLERRARAEERFWEEYGDDL